MSQIAEIVTFLKARLREEETEAFAASPGPWHVNAESDEVLAVDGITVADGFALSGRQLRATTSHIARYNPVRALAEIEIKRRMIDETWGGPDHADMREYHLWLLTLPYADHPEFKESWRP